MIKKNILLMDEIKVLFLLMHMKSFFCCCFVLFLILVSLLTILFCHFNCLPGSLDHTYHHCLVGGVCNSVLSLQTKIWIHGWTSVTAPCNFHGWTCVIASYYSSALFRKQIKIHPWGVRAVQPKKTQREEAPQPNFGSSFLSVLSPPSEPALWKLG